MIDECISGDQRCRDELTLSVWTEGLFIASAAVALALSAVLVIRIAMLLNAEPSRRRDRAGWVLLGIAGGVSIVLLGISSYGLWIYQSGGLLEGSPSLATYYPGGWISVRVALVASAVAVTASSMIVLSRLNLCPRGILGHSAPGIALIVAALISLMVAQQSRQVAAMLVVGVMVATLYSTLRVLYYNRREELRRSLL